MSGGNLIVCGDARGNIGRMMSGGRAFISGEFNDNDNLETKSSKKIMNAKKREVYQIEKVREGFVNALPDDIIIISDLDEIPNLENVDFKKINHKPLDNNASYLHETELAHLDKNDLKLLSVKKVLPWTRGNAIYWEAKSLHCSNDYKQKGMTSKQAIVIHTYKEEE